MEDTGKRSRPARPRRFSSAAAALELTPPPFPPPPPKQTHAHTNKNKTKQNLVLPSPITQGLGGFLWINGACVALCLAGYFGAMRALRARKLI